MITNNLAAAEARCVGVLTCEVCASSAQLFLVHPGPSRYRPYGVMECCRCGAVVENGDAYPSTRIGPRGEVVG